MAGGICQDVPKLPGMGVPVPSYPLEVVGRKHDRMPAVGLRSRHEPSSCSASSQVSCSTGRLCWQICDKAGLSDCVLRAALFRDQNGNGPSHVSSPAKAGKGPTSFDCELQAGLAAVKSEVDERYRGRYRDVVRAAMYIVMSYSACRNLSEVAP
jgi:hypothetical protein